ncbi:cupredoxin [Penicillium lagena]|uniref:cupredoxin n=1 Tax=Penicillium lagena TaxID=94218 RepID=UPI002541002D|nr:cupredoxin [Penicillium lagena]KAJ5624328.1 cupredoxin [Penicillium lagena]
MKASLSLLVPFVLPLAAAQWGGGSGSGGSQTTTTTAATTTMSSSSSSSTHSVNVGKDGFTFEPDTLMVSPGDEVEFHFFPGDHSVAQAAFNNPCQPMSSSSFYSGSFPGSSESSNVFVLTVNDTNPIWFYCGQVGHCQAGMVGVINPPSSGADTLEAFKKAASGTKSSNVPAMVQGGVIQAASEDNNDKPSSTSTAASATSTNGAKGVRPWAEFSVVFVLTSMVAMFMA